MKPLIIPILISCLLLSCNPKSEPKHLEESKSSNLPKVPFEPWVFNIDTNSHWLVNLAVKKGPVLAPSFKTRNCVEFMHDLLNPSYSFTEAEKNSIFIKSVSLKQVRTAIDTYDSSKITGICKVLVNKDLATWVSATDSLKPGDIVQYWWHNGVALTGHTGIVGEADGRNFHLISSGFSQNGFGYRYCMEGYCQAFYAVRLKQ